MSKNATVDQDNKNKTWQHNLLGDRIIIVLAKMYSHTMKRVARAGEFS